MPLPTIDVPTYTLKIPSSGQEITIRPFLVKEEKILLIAVESKDEKEIIQATKQIVNNCIITEGINIDKLPFFDVDYIFIALRAKSLGDTIDVNFTCNNTTSPGSEVGDHYVCGNVMPVKIDISNCSIVKDETIPMDYNLSSTIRIKMKYPSYSVMKNLEQNENALQRKTKIIAACITQVIDKDKIYTEKDFTPQEMMAFIDNLKQDQLKPLEKFIDNFPSFIVNADATCKKCGFDHKIRYDDFTRFFT